MSRISTVPKIDLAKAWGETGPAKSDCSPGWPDEVIEHLKVIWHTGLSASQCAKEISRVFGIRKTRNAVIAKIHRMGWAGRATPSAPPRRLVARNSPRPAVVHHGFAEAIQRPSLRRPEPIVSEPIPVSAVIDIADHQCKWPMGSGFCSRAKAGRGPYCADHAAAAYVARSRKRKSIHGDPGDRVSAYLDYLDQSRAQWSMREARGYR